MSDSVVGRRWRHGAAWGLVIALSLAPTAVIKSDNGPRGREVGGGHERGRSGARARDAARGRGTDKVDLLVRYRRTPGTSEHALVRGMGGEARRQMRSSSRWLSLRVPAHRLAALAASDNVDYVSLDEPVMTNMDVARGASNQPVAPAPESAFKGAGVTIAVVDSGVALHPDFQTLTTVVDAVGRSNPQAAPPSTSIDPYGHGTHVAGIMVGNGSHSSNGRMAGVAPEAGLVSVRVLDNLGRGMTSDVLAGLQWILAHKDEYGIRVVNISLGHPIYEAAADDPLVEAVDELWDAGVVVVCSAGNRGRDGHVTVTSPCNSRKVITVGATNHSRTAPHIDDKVATYSSRGPTAFDLFAKPDLVAPGNRIVSLRSPGSRLDVQLPDRRVAGDPAHPNVFEYTEMSGTSMASPIVAATAALMIEQDPWLNPASVKARLMMSARKPRFGDPLLTGAGSLDILGALRANWTAAEALSPKALPDIGVGRIAFENTAVLWGNEAFSLRALWANSVSWSDPSRFADPILHTDGEMWPAGGSGAQGELWPNGEVWPEGEMWPDCPVWTPGVTAPEPGAVLSEALSSGFRDP